MHSWTQLQKIAAAQYGHVTVVQARAAGFSDRTVRNLVERQSWAKVHRAVYRLPGSWPTEFGRVAAALLAVGPPVYAAGLTSAWLHGLERTLPRVIEVLVPHDRRVRGLVDVACRRTRTLDVSQQQLCAGLPCTDPVRTLCDLAAVFSEDRLRALIIDARQRRLVDLATVSERAGRLNTAKGGGLLRRLVWELDAERCDSVLEHRLRRRLAEHGFQPHPEPVAVDIGGRVLHVDIGWPERRVGIEADGFAAHSRRASLDKDVLRHNALARVGWRILRASWPDAGDRFDHLARNLTALLG